MALETYVTKRDFHTTPEPEGKVGPAGGNTFVIQKHHATRLHYDLRLELDGVLLSWAVTKGPSLIAGEKRLAVHVEDHPLDYGGFEGTIPKGEYGGGTVILWDNGTWTPEGDPRKGYAKGHLQFDLQGQKLGGRWNLVRMHGKPGEKRENWLLIKVEDAFAQPPDAPDILEERPKSVKSGRVIGDFAKDPPKAAAKKRKSPVGPVNPVAASPADTPDPATIKGAVKAPVPAFVEPMLASLAPLAPTGQRWLHEIKFDGYRLQARIEAGRVKLFTRGGLDWTRKFGTAMAEALQNLPLGTAVIDGELVVETETGVADFSALQADLSAGRSDRFVYYVFDLLYLDGYDLRSLPLTTRKDMLGRVVSDQNGLLRLSGDFDDSGATVLRHACRLGLEGIVSKLKDAPYRSGRGKAWQKSKCSSRQEFVIAGYVPSTVSRRAIGSLVLGVQEGGALQHVGRVGTGFTAAMSEALFAKLERLRVPDSPFPAALTAAEARQVRYVRPDLVAEVAFSAWTADGHLRHASFRGLRDDKKAGEIMREDPETRDKSAAGFNVTLTHPDRIYWPDAGVTKQGLADYYAEVWDHIAPHITGRPLALLRCPTGIAGEQFFQKNAWKGLNPAIVLVNDPKDKGDDQLISIDSLDGLIGLVQASVLEIHPWGSTLADWQRPDRIVMDLDPGEDVTWANVIAAALEVRDRLAAAGLGAFVKTSGGKGLHVVAPLTPKADWPQVKAFAKSMADQMASDSPDLYVATVTKSKRHGKILIDYLRNQRGATAVAAFSTRARPGAAVSAPLAWEELGPGIGPAHFTVENMLQRLTALSTDPWSELQAAARPLQTPAARKRK